MDALELLTRYTDRSGQDRFHPSSERVPVDGVVPRDWRVAVVDETGRIERTPYELCVLRALRNAVRRREVSVVGQLVSTNVPSVTRAGHEQPCVGA